MGIHVGRRKGRERPDQTEGTRLGCGRYHSGVCVGARVCVCVCVRERETQSEEGRRGRNKRGKKQKGEKYPKFMYENAASQETGKP